MSVYVGYFGLADKAESIDSSLLYITLLSLVLMVTSIAGKYATYPKITIRKLKETVVTQAELDAEMMLGTWKGQGLRIRKFETDNAIERLEIDQAIFMMTFMAEPSALKLANLNQLT